MSCTRLGDPPITLDSDDEHAADHYVVVELGLIIVLWRGEACPELWLQRLQGAEEPIHVVDGDTGDFLVKGDIACTDDTQKEGRGFDCDSSKGLFIAILPDVDECDCSELVVISTFGPSPLDPHCGFVEVVSFIPK